LQETAQQAFQFCLRYKRTTEFRRLADILRNHLKQLKEASHGGAPAPILASPESLQLHLETRFIQLNVAADLELWQVRWRSSAVDRGPACSSLTLWCRRHSAPWRTSTA
jgi:translation initiation factor 3 subunit A